MAEADFSLVAVSAPARKLTSNLQALRIAKADLQALEKDIRRRIDREEGSRYRVLDRVKVWLSETEASLAKADQLLMDGPQDLRKSLGGDNSNSVFVGSVAKQLDDIRSLISQGDFSPLTEAVTPGVVRRNQRPNADRPNSLATAASAAAVVMDSEEWLILIASLIVEGLSAVFEQLGNDLLGFQMAVFGLLICVAEILYRARTERVSLEWVGNLPFLYSRYPKYKPFGTTVQCFGLLAAVWQCFHASLGYYYARKNLQNPIKMTLTMFLFCVCLIVSKIVNKYTRRPLSGAHSP